MLWTSSLLKLGTETPCAFCHDQEAIKTQLRHKALCLLEGRNIFKYTQILYLKKKAVVLHNHSVERKRPNNHSSKLRCNAELHQYWPIVAYGWLWGQGIQEIVYHHIHYYLSPGDIFEGMAGFQGLLLLKIKTHIGVPLIHVYPMRLSVTERPSFVCAAVGTGGLFPFETPS